MSIDNDTSTRIEILRFPLIVGVVFIHTYSGKIYGTMVNERGGGNWIDYVEVFFSCGIVHVTVPLFFLISGYLFFQGKWSFGNYVNKLERRVSTLLVPYLFWNCLTLGIFALIQSIPQTRAYYVGTVWPPVRDFSALDYAKALLGVFVGSPIAGPLWFIRDLMILVVLAPAIHFLLARKSALPFLIVLFCLYFIGLPPSTGLRMEAPFFFCMGAYFSRPEMSVTSLGKFNWLIGAIFLCLLTLNTAFLARVTYLNNAMVVFGVPCVWYIAKLAAETTGLKSLLMKLSGASFFVFAAHEPLQTIARKASDKLLMPAGGTAILALYFLIPICIITFLVLLHGCLWKVMPSVTGVITGDTYRRRICPGQ